jgi:dihydroorotate dehydrogenase (NAD+) catalytic subunit
MIVGRVRIDPPIMNASGVVAASAAGALKVEIAGAGAVVTKTFTVKPRVGNKAPIAVPYLGGLINSVGLANPGIEGLREYIKEYRKLGGSLPVIVSIGGEHLRSSVN